MCIEWMLMRGLRGCVDDINLFSCLTALHYHLCYNPVIVINFMNVAALMCLSNNNIPKIVEGA
jgi:hypothetical protein